MNISDIRKAIEVLGKVKASTGDAYSAESAAEAIIKLNILKGEIEAVEKQLKETLPKEILPYEGTLGKIALVETKTYEQDAKAIFDSGAIPEKDFWRAVSLKKGAFDKKTEAGKHALAIIALNEKVTGASTSLKVYKNEKIEKDFDFTIG